MASYFLRNFLRLWFIKYGSFSNVNKSSMGERIQKEMSESKFDSVFDFTFNCIGYEDDKNMSPLDRYSNRREMMENVDNPSYWKDKSKKMGAGRTSEVVESFKYLGIQGLGKENISIQSSKYYIPNFQKFVENNKELIDVFCSGFVVMDSKYLNVNKEPVPVGKLVQALASTSAKEFEKRSKDLKLDFSNIMNLKESNSIKICGNTVFIPRGLINEFGEEQIQKFLLYAALLKVDVLPLSSIGNFMNYLPKCMNLFNIGNSDFLNIIDLGFMTGRPVAELLEVAGFSIPDPESMLKLTRGIYIFNNPNVMFIPSSLPDERAMNCVINATEFCSLVNKELLSEIIYRDGIPYLGTMILR